MPVLSTRAQRILALILADALFRGLTPSLDGRRWELFTTDAGRVPPALLLALSFLSFLLIATVPLFRPSNRVVFVFGVGLSGAGTLIAAKATNYGLFTIGESVGYVGGCLFAAAAFVLEAECLPRRWLLVGLTAYFAVDTLAGWLQPILLRPLPLFTERLMLVGALVIGLSALSGLVFAHEPREEPDFLDERPTQISRGARRRLLTLLGLFAIATQYLNVPVPESYNLYLGQYGPFDGPETARVLLAQGVPFAMIAFLLIGGIGLRSAVRTLSITLVGLILVGWWIPSLRAYTAPSVTPILGLDAGVVAIALARSTRPKALKATIGVQLVTGMCGAIIAQVFARIPSLHRWPTQEALPIGASLSFTVIMIAILMLLFRPDTPVRPGSHESSLRPTS